MEESKNSLKAKLNGRNAKLKENLRVLKESLIKLNNLYSDILISVDETHRVSLEQSRKIAEVSLIEKDDYYLEIIDGMKERSQSMKGQISQSISKVYSIPKSNIASHALNIDEFSNKTEALEKYTNSLHNQVQTILNTVELYHPEAIEFQASMKNSKLNRLRNIYEGNYSSSSSSSYSNSPEKKHKKDKHKHGKDESKKGNYNQDEVYKAIHDIGSDSNFQKKESNINAGKPGHGYNNPPGTNLQGPPKKGY